MKQVMKDKDWHERSHVDLTGELLTFLVSQKKKLKWQGDLAKREKLNPCLADSFDKNI